MTGYRKLKGWKSVILAMLFITFVIPSPAGAAGLPEQNEKPHIVFLISEDPHNYEAHKTIPQFADMLNREHDLVVFFRRIALPHEQLNMIKHYLKKGKPLDRNGP